MRGDLELQILDKWGLYGDWKSADVNQAADLARLFEAHGIVDLDGLQFRQREYVNPGGEYETETGTVVVSPAKQVAFDAFYNGKQLNYLGDINNDDSISVFRPQRFDKAIGVGNPNERYILDHEGTLRGDRIAWSAKGHGNTAFVLRVTQAGEIVLVPQWGSSSQETFDDIRGIAKVALFATGAQYGFSSPETNLASEAGEDMLFSTVDFSNAFDVPVDAFDVGTFTDAPLATFDSLYPLPNVEIPIPDITIAPVNSFTSVVRDVTGAVREISSVALPVLQTVRAFQNGGGKISSTNARVINPNTGLVNGSKPIAGLATIGADGTIIVNNGDGTFTIIDTNGNSTTRSYKAVVQNSSLFSDPKMVALAGGAAILALIALRR